MKTRLFLIGLMTVVGASTAFAQDPGRQRLPRPGGNGGGGQQQQPPPQRQQPGRVAPTPVPSPTPAPQIVPVRPDRNPDRNPDNGRIDLNPNRPDLRPDRPGGFPGRPDDRFRPRPGQPGFVFRPRPDLDPRFGQFERQRQQEMIQRLLMERRNRDNFNLIEDMRRRRFMRWNSGEERDYIDQRVLETWSYNEDPRTVLIGYTILSDDMLDFDHVLVQDFDRYREVKVKVIGDGAYLNNVTINFCQKTFADRLQSRSQSFNLGGGYYPEYTSTDWLDVGFFRCVDSFSVLGIGERDNGWRSDETIVLLLGKRALQ